MVSSYLQSLSKFAQYQVLKFSLAVPVCQKKRQLFSEMPAAVLSAFVKTTREEIFLGTYLVVQQLAKSLEGEGSHPPKKKSSNRFFPAHCPQ